MGKDLRGKELGVGLSQRKDGLYMARFTSRQTGKKVTKYFKKLRDAKNWYADATFQDLHGTIQAATDMTVTAWYEYWINEIKGGIIKEGTRESYGISFERVRESLGNMTLANVKPMHIQKVLNDMNSTYSPGTIEVERRFLTTLFRDAVENELLQKSPVNSSIRTPKVERNDRVLSIEEQKRIVDITAGKRYGNQYAFILQTGLRIAELSGLKWSDIDRKDGVIHVVRTLTYRNGKWKVGTPKTASGKRQVPLTSEAIRILCDEYQNSKERKIVNQQFADYIFLGKNGKPIYNSTYDRHLYLICDKFGFERFSVHTLRHTFATRCIEAGMRPKTLQVIMGHANISTTLDLYVHVTKEEQQKEMGIVEKALSAM